MGRREKGEFFQTGTSVECDEVLLVTSYLCVWEGKIKLDGFSPILICIQGVFPESHKCPHKELGIHSPKVTFFDDGQLLH
jgi:hypothetical protein